MLWPRPATTTTTLLITTQPPTTPTPATTPPTTPAPTTPAPTAAPMPSAPIAECTFWGDPHIQTFDGGRPSFYGEGEQWIVRSQEVWIQGRYMGTKFTKGLAATNKVVVGGPFLKGHVVEVGTLESGELTVDGQPVLYEAFPPPKHNLAGLGTLTYSEEGELVDAAAGIWEKRVVRMDLPKTVTVTVFRWKNYIDLRVRMPRQPDQDGSCGNFNGDATDDTTEAIQLRIGARVAPGELLFGHRAELHFTPEEERLLETCAPAHKANALKVCSTMELQGPHIPGQMKSCLINNCLGANEHALKYAKSIGL